MDFPLDALKAHVPGWFWLGLIVVATVIIGFGHVGDSITKVLNAANALRPSPARRARASARTNIAALLRDRVDRLADREDWASQPFTELEVEVQPGDRKRKSGERRLLWMTPRRRLQHRRSLTRVLRRGSDALVLVTGDAGSGKSVALRHLASRVAAQAARSRRRRGSTIPIYVNLKALERRGRKVDGRLVRSVVMETLTADASPTLATAMREEFDRGLKEGTWLFLFDSFDELPEVLSATEENRMIEAYTQAIEVFTEGHPCRVVVASRLFRAPRHKGWTTLRIMPLSDERKRHFIERSGLTGETRRTLLDGLATAQSDVPNEAANPLFLALLCEYMRHERDLPTTSYEVFDSAIGQRLADGEPTLRESFGFAADDLRGVSACVAFVMQAAALGLEPRRTELLAGMRGLGFDADEATETALDALEYVKLARKEGEKEQSNDARRFTFAHRRFQEYFATLEVLEDQHRVTVESLLGDAQWRETAVALCQTRPDAAGELLAQARILLHQALHEVIPAAAPADGGRSAAFNWPPGSLHLLGLLQSGFAAAPDRLPDDVRATAGRILEAAWACGEDDDRKLVLEVTGTAPDAVRTQMLSAAFRTGNGWLSEVAYRQVARLRDVPSELTDEMRRALVGMAAAGRLRRERETVHAQIKRLETGRRLLWGMRLLLVVPVVDLLVHVATGMLAVVTPASSERVDAVFTGISILALVVSYRSWPGIADAIAQSGRRAESSRPNGTDKWVRVLPGLTARFLAIIFVWGVLSALTIPVPLAAVLAVFAFTWPLAALVAVVRGEVLRPPWLLVHVAVIKGLSVRSVLGASAAGLVGGLIGLGVAAALISAASGVDVPAWVGWTLYGVFMAAMLILIVVMAVRTFVHDWAWYIRWRRSPTRQLTPNEILDLVGEQRTSRGIVRLISDVRSERLLKPGTESEHVVRDLLRVSRLATDDAAAETLYESEQVPRWLDHDGEKKVRLISAAGVELREELGPLVEELRARREELPTA